MPLFLQHIYTAAACFNARNARCNPNKGNSMKRFLVLGMAILASAAHAGTLEVCNKTSADSQTQLAFQPFGAYRGQVVVTGSGLAPSITLPSLVTANPAANVKNLIINFQNRNDFQFCLDTTGSVTGGASPSNNWCGTNPPVTTVSNTAWVFKQSSVRVLAVSGSIPTVMYVSGSAAGVTGYSICGEQ